MAVVAALCCRRACVTSDSAAPARPSLSTWVEALAPLTISDSRAGMERFPNEQQGEHVASSARGRRPWAGGWRWNGTSRPAGARAGQAAHVHGQVQGGGPCGVRRRTGAVSYTHLRAHETVLD